MRGWPTARPPGHHGCPPVMSRPSSRRPTDCGGYVPTHFRPPDRLLQLCPESVPTARPIVTDMSRPSSDRRTDCYGHAPTRVPTARPIVTVMFRPGSDRPTDCYGYVPIQVKNTIFKKLHFHKKTKKTHNFQTTLFSKTLAFKNLTFKHLIFKHLPFKHFTFKHLQTCAYIYI